jgi:hypothetical protein
VGTDLYNPRWMYLKAGLCVFGVSSSRWFYALAVGLLLPAILPAWRERLAQLGALGYIAVLVLLPYVSLTPRKPFRQFYSAIDTGMTQDDVREMLGRRFPSRGRFARPVEHADDVQLFFQLDPGSGWYNAECVVVKMVDGKVVAKEYLPD